LVAINPRVTDLNKTTIGFLHDHKIASKPILKEIETQLLAKFTGLKSVGLYVNTIEAPDGPAGSPASLVNGVMIRPDEWLKYVDFDCLAKWLKTVDTVVVAVGD